VSLIIASSLFTHLTDPSNAVIFDREWLMRALSDRHLRVASAAPPRLRGSQWQLEMQCGTEPSIDLPQGLAPFGRRPPPPLARPAHLIGR
jgi:hypothetical protein